MKGVKRLPAAKDDKKKKFDLWKSYNDVMMLATKIVPVAKWIALPVVIGIYRYLEPDTPAAIVFNPVV
jgi:hypothetical protein